MVLIADPNGDFGKRKNNDDAGNGTIDREKENIQGDINDDDGKDEGNADIMKKASSFRDDGKKPKKNGVIKKVEWGKRKHQKNADNATHGIALVRETVTKHITREVEVFSQPYVGDGTLQNYTFTQWDNVFISVKLEPIDYINNPTGQFQTVQGTANGAPINFSSLESEYKPDGSIETKEEAKKRHVTSGWIPQRRPINLNVQTAPGVQYRIILTQRQTIPYQKQRVRLRRLGNLNGS